MGLWDNLITGGLFGFLGKAIDKIFPDPEEKAKAQVALMEATLKGELAQLEAETNLALGQLEVNKVEAASTGFFRGGWRPAVGWICAFGLGYQVIVRPLLAWISPAIGLPSVPPGLEMDSLMTLLFGMLGLGAYRSYEKTKNVP